MTATDELRRLLDERGVEWWAEDDPEDPPYYLVTKWFSNANEQTFEEIPAIRSRALRAYCVTPEQAVEATLGRGTCRDVRSTDHTIAFECSECGCWVAYDEYWETGIYVPHETGQEHIHPHYCPNCGRKVVE